MKRVRFRRVRGEAVSHDPALVKRVLLRAGEVEGVLQLAHCRLPPGRSTSAHVHRDMTEVFLAVAGRGWAACGRRRVRLEPFDCVVIHPGATHRLGAARDSALELIYFGVRTRR
ncbi:MAG: cupin domain-containing protein [Kiritimatiellae bacterium]|nr:cupin domain-containing protein [Kiritimatiellia bacterium]